MKHSVMNLWPTRVSVVEFTPQECSQANELITSTVLAHVEQGPARGVELRLKNLEQIDCSGVRWLTERVRAACQEYLGEALPVSVALRAVVLQPGQHINTHTESHESDLMVAYWPGGCDLRAGEPISRPADPTRGPAFLLEDPSRSLTDLRLPHEDRHSIHVCPRPGMLVVAPAHLPHNLWPYLGKSQFFHIVAQVRVSWPEGFLERF